jgi:hypothetical protein
MVQAQTDNPTLTRALNRVFGGAKSEYTVDDFDSVRKSLRAAAKAMRATDTTRAADINLAATKLSEFATSRNEAYGTALDQYSRASDYISGFNHGKAGKLVGDAAGPMSDVLNSIEGKAGYQHGSVVAKAEQVAARIAPTTVQPQVGETPQKIAHAAAAVAYHSPTGIVYHLSQAIPGFHMSEATQRVLEKQLFSRDPAIVAQGVKNLRRGGAVDADISRLAARIGGATALNIASALKGQ